MKTIEVSDETYEKIKDQIETDKMKFEKFAIAGLNVSVEMDDSTLPFPIRVGIGDSGEQKSDVWGVDTIRQFIKALQSAIDHVESNK